MSARSEKKRRYYHHHHSKSGTKFSPAPQLLHAYFLLQDHLATTISLDSFIEVCCVTQFWAKFITSRILEMLQPFLRER